jgi:hypothetical protein
MAIVLSNQENIDLLLILVKVAIALGAIAIVLWFLFWLRLKNLEKRLYFGRKQLQSQFSVRNPQKTYAQKTQRTLVATQIAHRPTTNVRTNVRTNVKTNAQINRKRSSLITHITQVDRPTTYGNYPKTLKKSPKRSVKSNWRWGLAISLASITGIAIALLQLGNSLISPEFTTLLWFSIGVMIVVSATLVEN